MRLVGTLYTIVYLLMVLVMFVLPVFSFEGYSLVGNSLDELGAQASPGNWVMNTVIILLAIVTAILGTKALRRFWLPLYLLYFFSFSLLFMGIYKHAPVATELLLWGREHITHSVFSMIAGACFSLYCLVIALRLQKPKDKVIAFVMLLLAIVLSFLMFNLPEYKGIFQRVLFLTAFAWIFYSLVSFDFDRSHKTT